jgi:transposase
VELLTAQIRELEGLRPDALRTAADPVVAQVCRLLQRRGIGANSAWLYVLEFIGWRGFRNRREVGRWRG